MSSFDLLISLGAKIGSKLIGSDHEGTDIIEIVSLDNGRVSAKFIEYHGKKANSDPANWDLTLREWKLLEI